MALFYPLISFHPHPPPYNVFLGELHAIIETFHLHNNAKCLMDDKHCSRGGGVIVRLKTRDGIVEVNVNFDHFLEMCLVFFVGIVACLMLSVPV